VRDRAGLADVSWIAKLDLKGPGLSTPPDLPARARSWHLGVSHYLVTSESGCALPDLRLPGPPDVYATDVTSVFAALLLAGPRSREVLRKLTSLNVSDTALPEGGCGQASLAHVHATLLRRDLSGVPGFLLLVSREYAESVWEAVLHAGHEAGLQPFGLEALRQLGF
jgi:glycine cleavage system aminomethyltransferase T